ncbi:MAG: hypothetical protein Q8O19_04200 [Rectinemataceae bacterium]|nr:hypothetical protein [Rectinemataceae bacterium]
MVEGFRSVDDERLFGTNASDVGGDTEGEVISHVVIPKERTKVTVEVKLVGSGDGTHDHGKVSTIGHDTLQTGKIEGGTAGKEVSDSSSINTECNFGLEVG